MGNIQQFTTTLHTKIIPQAICLSLHIFCAVSLIMYLYLNRKRTPIIQNSPILTIAAQIMLVCSSLCLFAGKFVFIWYNDEKNGRYDHDDVCFVRDEDIDFAAMLSLMYTFCIQFMYMSYLLKMIRVLFITFQESKLETWQWLFSSETKLIVASALWGALIATADALMKIFMYDDGNQPLKLHAYPQFDQFLCDFSRDQFFPIADTIIYNGKLVIYLFLFLWSFCYSYRLEEIDNDLRLRIQYFILLFLPYSVIITDKIFKVIDPSINTSMEVHYVDCLSNLLAGFVLMGLHFNVAKNTDFSLPDQNDLSDQFNADVVDLSYIFDKEEIRETVRGYFQYRGKEQLFNVQLQLLDVNFNHLENSKAKINRMLEGLDLQQKQDVMKSTYRTFEAAKQKVNKNVRKLLNQWKYTISGRTLIQKLKRNGKYYKKMQKLKLVNPSLNSRQYNSQAQIIYTK